MRLPQERDSGLALIPILGIRDDYFLPERYSRLKHHEGAMRADGHCKGLLAERSARRILAANHDWHVQEEALTSSLSCLWHSLPSRAKPHRGAGSFYLFKRQRFAGLLILIQSLIGLV